MAIVPSIEAMALLDRDAGVGRRAGRSREALLSVRRADEGRRGQRIAVVDVGGRHRGVGQDAVDAVGIVVGRQVLEGVRAEVERIDPDRRGQVGVGGGPVAVARPIQ